MSSATPGKSRCRSRHQQVLHEGPHHIDQFRDRPGERRALPAPIVTLDAQTPRDRVEPREAHAIVDAASVGSASFLGATDDEVRAVGADEHPFGDAISAEQLLELRSSGPNAGLYRGHVTNGLPR